MAAPHFARRSIASRTRRATSLAAAVAIAACGFGTATPARAQSQTGFAVDRFEPAERGSQFFVVDSLDLRRGAAAAGVALDYAYKPLVIYDATGAERFAVVRHQAILHLGGSIVLGERLRLAIDAPLALYQDGERAVVGAESLEPATSPAFGDLRLAADVRLFGEHDAPFTLAAGVRLWLPTGLRSQFTSDGSARLAPQLLGAGALGPFVWGARIAVVYRSRNDDYAGRSLGSELFAAAGAGVRAFSGRLVVGPEIYGSSAFGGGAAFLGKRETPVDWTFGAHYDVLPNVRVGAGFGSGLGHGYGAPLFRGLASIELVTAPPPPPPRHESEEPNPWEGTEGVKAPRVVAPPPLAVMTESEIHIEEQLRFATDSAELVGDSDAVLGAVKRVLDEHPEIARVRIEGHTDSVGDPTYNDELSARRATAVMTWLVEHGVAASRLESAGFGSKQPIETNDTEVGRAKNRRVVFRIVDRAVQPAP